MNFIPYGTQVIEDDDITAVVETLKSEFLTQGAKVAEFEDALNETVGSKYAVVVSSGTAALHIIAMAIGLNIGDEVIVPPLTFAASANCALYCGATPVFADIDANSMLLDIESVAKKITPKTKAIIPVHYGGELCDMDAYEKLAKKHELTLIQDAAHSLGSMIRGKHQGAYSGFQSWSFHPVKTITTGEGGAVTTNDENMYKSLLRLRSHGITRDSSQYIHDGEGGWYYEMLELGYNYRLTDMQCALGISQLKKLKRFSERRREIVAHYNAAFNDLPIRIQHTPKWSEPVRHLYTIRLNNSAQRRKAFDMLRAWNLGVNVHYIPVYWLPHYEKLGYKRGLCPVAEESYNSMITLPLHPKMTDAQVNYVVECVNRLF
ncbi:MAG: UDP-4-amino-4,6-dideoxy-N-acetyl-beta-L-altrosamine transaminase [Oscillospiraceae bacterium]|nr:UDP-4-amino-4,6-dideoxy-N-acetyl-beta-L-altrosamine transaminase [Oscillospiraceae bacterium]MCL2279539.1 UDP-4-amino-4,6-dideoxy-N-acetyl-beta-L-altrosamine transaminase [Oscillospiraceae bacterium]